jgi:hypothetical protein
MATQQTQVLGRALLTPGVLLLFVWMIVPLAMTIYFSTLHYSLLDPESGSFVGLENFRYFLTDPAFLASLQNTLVLVGSVLAITILLGTPLALLLDQPVIGRNLVRLMVIAPFFVMPTVSALVWKNLLMHPVSGLFAWIAHVLGLPAIDWFTDAPLLAVILIVSWQWLPFATLILLTALQSQDDHGGDPDRDDIPADGVCRDLRHYRRRPGTADHQHRVPDLLAGPDPVRRRQCFGRRTGRGRDRQHRGVLPGADHRPESGGIGDGT